MRIMGATALSGFAHRTAESASDFATVVRNLIMDVRDSYRPQLHYMRGPGPKTLSKLGEAFRDETEGDVRERIPEEWLTLVQSIAQRARDR